MTVSPIIQGQTTAALGKWLCSYFTTLPQDYSVYYDHGNPKCKNVHAVKCFFGTTVKNDNRLSDLDLGIFNQNKAEVLIEIEERTVSPKTILGDIFSVLLSDNIAIAPNNVPFKITNDTLLFIVGSASDNGSCLFKINNFLRDHIRALNIYTGGLLPKNIDLLFTSKLEVSICKLKDRIRRIYSKEVLK
jgi:hypothetical protein